MLSYRPTISGEDVANCEIGRCDPTRPARRPRRGRLRSLQLRHGSGMMGIYSVMYYLHFHTKQNEINPPGRSIQTGEGACGHPERLREEAGGAAGHDQHILGREYEL